MCRRAWCPLFYAVIVVGGCGKPPGLATYPVAGTVTYNDMPLVGAVVIFVGESRDAPRSSGTTDGDGKFTLTTYVSGSQILPGAPPGDYHIIVTKNSAVGGAGGGMDTSGMEKLSPEERAVQMQTMIRKNQDEAAEKPKSDVPEIYTDVRTTTLKATIVAGENPVELKLRD